MCSFPELIRFNVKLRIVFPMNKVSLNRLSENVSFQQHSLTHSSDFLISVGFKLSWYSK
jgi:hypothetical protein